MVKVSLMDCLAWLWNIIIVDVWEIWKHKLYDTMIIIFSFITD